MADTVGSIGERALVERLRAKVGTPRAHVHLGIGDDAAAFEPERGMLQVVTTDALVEDVHFRRAWTGARAIGHKALAVNLSDLAAMGAVPHSALLSLALPASFPLVDFDDLVDGFLELATREQTTLVGGNLTRSPGPVVVDVTALGAVRRRRLLRRSTALRGDELWVTGAIGAAATGLACLERGLDRHSLSASQLECVERYERPNPRTRVGRIGPMGWPTPPGSWPRAVGWASRSTWPRCLCILAPVKATPSSVCRGPFPAARTTSSRSRYRSEGGEDFWPPSNAPATYR
jgi:thiamine-monophosphate kinase